MKIANTSQLLSKHATRLSLTAAVALAAVSFAGPNAAFAQLAPTTVAPTIFLASAELPDAPGMTSAPSSSSSSSLDNGRQSSATYTPHAQLPASRTTKYIAPGQPVVNLTAGDKFALAFKDAFSLPAFGGWVLAAGYEQATNGSPNYGTNATAFGKRFGASVARATSEGVFSDGAMAAITREDPRYYRMGPGHNVFKRAGYAVTRTLITRTDSGRATPNIALLGGNLGGAYLTQTYYPDINNSNGETLKTFAGSIGGSALGFAVNEFFPNINFLTFHHRD